MSAKAGWLTISRMRLAADLALADVLVAVAVGAERGLGVVQVHHHEPLETDRLVERAEQRRRGPSAVRSSWPDSSRWAVSRHTPRRSSPSTAVDHGGRSRRTSRPWCRPPRPCFRAALARASRRTSSSARSSASRTRASPASKPAPWWEPMWVTIASTPSCSAAVTAPDQGDHRLLVEVLVRRRQVDQVDGVDDREAQRRRGARLAEARRVVVAVELRLPGARAAGEELDGLAAQLRALVDRRPDPAARPYVRAEVHPPPCVPGFLDQVSRDGLLP